ncbi:MAG TPA: 50S ribosomal protein L10 [Acholeplasmataceae bacterium]|nr:50S ribosomal protein L10 [Acholeplasmataceae bacterium]
MKEATLQKKVEQVNEVLEKFQNAGSTIFIDYLGLNVSEITELRKKLHAENCEMKVIKNNILKRAAELAGYEGLEDVFKGPSAVAISEGATNASKVIYDFAKHNDKLVVKAGVVEGKVIPLEDLKVIASLPDKNGMLSMLLSVLQAPIRNLACAIKAVSELEA